MIKKKIGIGIIGLGTVGSGLINILEKKSNYFKKTYNLDFSIVGITAKSKTRKRSFDIIKYEWFADPYLMINHPKIHILVELVGGSKKYAFKR